MKVPGWLVGSAVVVMLLAGVVHTAGDSERAKVWNRRADSVMGIAKALHDQQTAVLRDSLLVARTEQALAVGRAAAAARSVAPALVVVAETKAVLPVVDAGVDSGRMIRARDLVIAAQDTVIERQAVLVVALHEVIRADSGIARLYVRQREMDSLRIGALESTLASRPRAWRFLGIKLPTLECVAGYGGQAGRLEFQPLPKANLSHGAQLTCGVRVLKLFGGNS